ncbi:MAG: hypothetical protein CFE29_03530 [Bradyrhizobiaceae bacterium PARB1]|jgi:transcriptional regulator with XRE-family HTH domain|nr:MAG: hypothetical protein CFE29_03530 [Bradyrhizobiaceae bacterium PARB1]
MSDFIPVNESIIEAEENLLIDFQFLVQELLTDKGMTRAQLAERAGLSEARLSQLLSSRANPTVKTMARVFHALDVSILPVVKPSMKAQIADPLKASDEQWQCLPEAETPGYRRDKAMVASLKWSLASNDNYGRNVVTFEAA